MRYIFAYEISSDDDYMFAAGAFENLEVNDDCATIWEHCAGEHSTIIRGKKHFEKTKRLLRLHGYELLVFNSHDSENMKDCIFIVEEE